MRRVCFGLVLIFLVAGFARPASATAITFNEAGLVPGVGSDPYFKGSSKGTSMGDQLLSLGVSFSITDGLAYISSDAYLGASSSLLSGNYLTVNSFTPGKAATLSASFVDPLTGAPATVSGFSATVVDGNVDPIRMTVRAFDLGGNLLEYYSLTTLAAAFQFTSSNIARIDFIDNGGDGHIIDNFNFTLNRTTVPEPASMSLFAIGGAALALVRRRRR